MWGMIRAGCGFKLASGPWSYVWSCILKPALTVPNEFKIINSSTCIIEVFKFGSIYVSLPMFLVSCMDSACLVLTEYYVKDTNPCYLIYTKIREFTSKRSELPGTLGKASWWVQLGHIAVPKEDLRVQSECHAWTLHVTCRWRAHGAWRHVTGTWDLSLEQKELRFVTWKPEPFYALFVWQLCKYKREPCEKKKI